MAWTSRRPSPVWAGRRPTDRKTAPSPAPSVRGVRGGWSFTSAAGATGRQGALSTCRPRGGYLRLGEQQDTAEIGTPDVGRPQIGAEQVRADQVGATEGPAAQPRPPEVVSHQPAPRRSGGPGPRTASLTRDSSSPTRPQWALTWTARSSSAVPAASPSVTSRSARTSATRPVPRASASVRYQSASCSCRPTGRTATAPRRARVPAARCARRRSPG